jgi:hypothetical protein
MKTEAQQFVAASAIHEFQFEDPMLVETPVQTQ